LNGTIVHFEDGKFVVDVFEKGVNVGVGQSRPPPFGHLSQADYPPGHPAAGNFAGRHLFVKRLALDGAGDGDTRPLHLDSTIAINEDDFGTAAVVEGEVKGFVVPLASPIFVEGFEEAVDFIAVDEEAARIFVDGADQGFYRDVFDPILAGNGWGREFFWRAVRGSILLGGFLCFFVAFEGNAVFAVGVLLQESDGVDHNFLSLTFELPRPGGANRPQHAGLLFESRLSNNFSGCADRAAEG